MHNETRSRKIISEDITAFPSRALSWTEGTSGKGRLEDRGRHYTGKDQKDASNTCQGTEGQIVAVSTLMNAKLENSRSKQTELSAILDWIKRGTNRKEARVQAQFER